MPNELSEVARKASETYANNTALRAVITAIPYIGGSLDVIFVSKASKIYQERIKALLENLKTEMSLIGEEMIDKEYLRSEEFFDVVVKVIEASSRTRDREKIRLYAKLLCGSVAIQDRREFFAEDYLNILVELTPRELEVARAIYEQQGNSRPSSDETPLQWAWRMGWKKLPEKLRVTSRDDLPFVLQRVSRSGLIKEMTGEYVGYEGGVYLITETFRRLMDFLKVRALSE